MSIIEEVKAYKFGGELFETKEEAEKAEGCKRLEDLVEKLYYTGIDDRVIISEIIEHKEEFLSILQKICN